MIGSPGQIEWAEQIKCTIGPEFDRVANAFLKIAERQAEPDRAETLAVVALVKDIRVEVLANEHAGYFVQDWRELHDQVRRLLAQDPRYQAIRLERLARKKEAK